MNTGPQWTTSTTKSRSNLDEVRSEEDRVDECLHNLIETGEEFAQAKADMDYYKERLKAVVAIGTANAPSNYKTVAEKTAYAYSTLQYDDTLDLYRNAVLLYNKLLALRQAWMQSIDVYRTRQANVRATRF